MLFTCFLVIQALPLDQAAPLTNAPAQSVQPTQVQPVVQIIPTTNKVKNEVSNNAISGNAANRDQSNTAVSQTNRAEQQNLIGSQSDSHAVTVNNETHFVKNDATTNVTNTDQSVHNSNALTIQNDNSDRSQKTVMNTMQNIQNVYKVEQTQAPPSIQASPISNLAANSNAAPVTNNGPSNVYVNGRLTAKTLRDLIMNAKASSDMAYEMALQMVN